MTILKAWIIYAIWGVALYSAVFIWAVRSRQFTELDRQRRMALDRDLPQDEDIRSTGPGFADRCIPVVLAIVTILMVGAVLWLGLRRM